MNACRRALSAMTRRALYMTLKYMEGRLYAVFEGASSAETPPSVTRFFKIGAPCTSKIYPQMYGRTPVHCVEGRLRGKPLPIVGRISLARGAWS